MLHMTFHLCTCSCSIQVHRSGVLNASLPINILDNACGPAVLTELMYEDLAKKHGEESGNFSILCADIGPAMIDLTKEKIKKNGWKNVDAQIIDQNDLSSLKDGQFTHILTGLGINFVKDAQGTLKGGLELLLNFSVVARQY